MSEKTYTSPISKSQRLSKLQQKNDIKILGHIESLKDITMSLYTMVSDGDPRDELYKCGKNAWDIADKLYKLIRFKTFANRKGEQSI